MYIKALEQYIYAFIGIARIKQYFNQYQKIYIRNALIYPDILLLICCLFYGHLSQNAWILFHTNYQYISKISTFLKPEYWSNIV